MPSSRTRSLVLDYDDFFWFESEVQQKYSLCTSQHPVRVPVLIHNEECKGQHDTVLRHMYAISGQNIRLVSFKYKSKEAEEVRHIQKIYN
jgi:hypothetical protein